MLVLKEVKLETTISTTNPSLSPRQIHDYDDYRDDDHGDEHDNEHNYHHQD